MKIYTSAKPYVFKSLEILYNIEIGEGDDVSDSFSVIQTADAPSLAALKASFEFVIPLTITGKPVYSFKYAI